MSLVRWRGSRSGGLAGDAENGGAAFASAVVPSFGPLAPSRSAGRTWPPKDKGGRLGDQRTPLETMAALAYGRGMSLYPCAACARHRRGDGVDCPFCGARFNPREMGRPTSRGARAAIAFGGLALMSASAGCFAMAAGYGGPPPPSPDSLDASASVQVDAAPPSALRSNVTP